MSVVREVGPIRPESLSELLNGLFRASGADERDAAVVTEAIVDAELREIRSQGLLRLPNYIQAARNGKLKSPTQVTVEKRQPGALVLDAGHGWPHAAALQAFELCMEQAQQAGTCFAVVKRTGHIGRLGFFVEVVAKRGMIGLLMAGGNKGSGWVAPWGGVKPIWGTNPMAVGFPRRDAEPVVIDISTTQTSRGNVLMAQRLGQALPLGFGFDGKGNPTTDPEQALPPQGTLTPLGGIEAGHKGYALALMIHILCGVLGGPYPPEGGANFVGVLNIEAFIDRSSYEEGLRQLAEEIKAVPKKEGVDDIYLPGEHSAQFASRNRQRGLRFPESQWEELVQLARSLGVQHELLDKVQ